MKKKPLPLGISDFRNLIDGGYAYVDKTLLIEEIVEAGLQVALIARPRRFGKTLNLSMLSYFFEKREEDTSFLFKDLKIWQNPTCRAMQGQFPVIFMTFKDVKHASWEQTFEHFQRLIAEEFEKHRYLLESDLLSIDEKQDYHKILRKEGSQTLSEESLRLLIKWIYLYHKKPLILLIDEYDAPAHSAYVGGYYDPLISFLRNFLSGCLKDSSHIKHAVVTGILRIAKESIFSGLNNIITFTLLNEGFRDKFGLLESEVERLLENYNLSDKISDIRAWYDGYRIGSCTGVYNPWSVLKCIAEKGALSPYWVNTSDNALIKQLIIKSKGNFKADLEELLRGSTIDKKIEEGTIFPELEQGSHAIWSLLLFSGYLTIDATPSYGVHCKLRIPNTEIKELYQSMILSWFEKSLDEEHYQMLLNSLTKGDIDTFSRIFQTFMLSSASIFDITAEDSEKVYHAFVLGLLVGLQGKYEVKSNRESGLGRYDVMLIPKNTQDLGIILEFKKVDTIDGVSLESASLSAIKQIEEKHYAQELLDRGVSRILYLGLAFKGKRVFISHMFRD